MLLQGDTNDDILFDDYEPTDDFPITKPNKPKMLFSPKRL
jgi:hypothetical protein